MYIAWNCPGWYFLTVTVHMRQCTCVSVLMSVCARIFVVLFKHKICLIHAEVLCHKSQQPAYTTSIQLSQATVYDSTVLSVLPMLRSAIIGDSQHNQSLSQKALEGGIHSDEELLQWREICCTSTDCWNDSLTLFSCYLFLFDNIF